ncbi:TfuA-like protein [Micromonospora craniellae]|uniref:TfuA-like core domain-containing protein n=1 Tax=Micromonospora craniellae TaxID=2294034 RepID=A0A372FXU6_9ACTN|nr:TfuA-like protein [Micromonospora craniellae]RFS45622.1 hypothetical protein D0Q02_16145 [Micromonospora craniellae]
MTTHVFAGPTIVADEVTERLPEAVVHPPVRHGDLLALRLGPDDRVAIIDGVFFRTGAIRHKEIVHLLQQGVAVWGASSMGALRAAELDRFGMRGVGRIYRLYSSGVINGDDEVAVLHAEAEDGYRQMSEALVAVRLAVRRARVTGLLGPDEERHLVTTARRLPFGDRTYRRIVTQAVADGLSPTTGEALLGQVRTGGVDAKRADAHLLLHHLRHYTPGLPPAAAERMPMTSFLLRWQRSAPTTRVADVPVSDLAALTAVQLFGTDYPVLHRQIVLRELTGLPAQADPGEVAAEALRVARVRGLLGPETDPLPASFHHWLDETERQLPAGKAALLALVRSFRWTPNVRIVEPIVAALAGSEAWVTAQQTVARAVRCNEKLAAIRPTFNPHYIADAKLRAWVGRRWGVSEPVFALQDRGFGGQADLRARGAMFAPLDSVEPVASFPVPGCDG